MVSLAITDLREQVTHNDDMCIDPWFLRKMYSIYEADFLFNCFIKSYGAIKSQDFKDIFPRIFSIYGNLKPSGCTPDLFGLKDIIIST